MLQQEIIARRPSRGSSTLELLLLLVIAAGDGSHGCLPGRGRYSRGRPPRLQPLVFRQRFPNVHELALTASGPVSEAIGLDHADFQHLVPNYNPDIVFRDDEGTGEDRVMTQRASDRLNILSVSVMNYWPGVRLRVLEAWSEDRYDPSELLHLSGRAVHIATSDHDPRKLGALARMAVQAGFDFVYFRSRSWIHCSVKQDTVGSSDNPEGCFSADSVLRSDSGSFLNMSQIPSNNAQVATIDQSGSLVMTPVITWLHFDPEKKVRFVVLATKSGRQLTVTPNHLLYVLPLSFLATEQYSNGRLQQSMPHDLTLIGKAVATQAGKVKIGSYLLVWDGESMYPDVVVSLTHKYSMGVYAPLTSTGTLLVNDLLVSCYAQVQSHQTAHMAIAPLRWTWQLRQWVCQMIECSSDNKIPQHGIHWYARLLLNVTKYFLPSNLNVIEI